MGFQAFELCHPGGLGPLDFHMSLHVSVRSTIPPQPTPRRRSGEVPVGALSRTCRGHFSASGAHEATPSFKPSFRGSSEGQ